MDWSTLIGIVVGGALLAFGLDRAVLPVFLNAHGILLVLGGTAAAGLISTPPRLLVTALGALRHVLFPDALADPQSLSEDLVRLAERRHREGLGAFSGGRLSGDAFLAFAIEAAQERPDAQHIRRVLEEAVRQRDKKLQRAAGVFQTAAALAPMFGLLGTIVGIVGVLKDISNPATIGPAMAVAVTTAFYGILVSALVCTPIASKIRARAQEERRLRELVLLGMVDILSGAIPLEVERHLQAFCDGAGR
ncbi:MAG: MotA/TolQ/ExbB proton channel family protein [Elusimicrobia bacterium]|nr:MotA/TolQ/ExbB proton channel family protein [Elusimicrobiota bacterium]